MDISIVIPFYNAGDVLKNCIESVTTQIGVSWELILVDDGSTDESSKIATDFSRKYENIQVFRQANQGVSVARNRGISLSKGKYIYFLDSDDVIKRNALQNMIRDVVTDKYPDLIIFGYEMINVNRIITKQIPKKRVLSGCTFRTDILSIENEVDLNSIWNKCYRLEFLKEIFVDFPEGVRIGEDAVFNYSVFRKVNIVSLLPDVLYQYTMERQGSAMNSHTSDKIELQLRVMDEFRKMLQEFGIDSKKNDLQKMLGLVYQHIWSRCERNQILGILRIRKIRLSSLLFGVTSIKDLIKFGIVIFISGKWAVTH
ncbi:group 2 family Glycosyl transferase [Lactiplantibacillus paraplantarum]|uniref:glycosyltransferase n=1 Tax=Lactobacillaceae TaxID=33958 RepID=UPI0003AE40C0|nr:MULTISPECIES: glycosyltransferase [Lactobacillaceae]ERL44698.1 group 2 family Glycosyl transferase [Lactiplantibacillus paraplantarum]